MSISDEVLSEPRNSYIALRGTATVGQAIATLFAQGGQAWWHLIVEKDPDRFGCTSFAQLYYTLKEMPDAADLRLGEWTGLVPASAVDYDTWSTSKAQQVARQSPTRLVVVTRGGLPIGILFEGVIRGESQQPVSVKQLTELAGTYVNLKDYAAVLLSSSKKPKS